MTARKPAECRETSERKTAAAAAGAATTRLTELRNRLVSTETELSALETEAANGADVDVQRGVALNAERQFLERQVGGAEANADAAAAAYRQAALAEVSARRSEVSGDGTAAVAARERAVKLVNEALEILADHVDDQNQRVTELRSVLKDAGIRPADVEIRLEVLDRDDSSRVWLAYAVSGGVVVNARLMPPEVALKSRPTLGPAPRFHYGTRY